MNFILIALSVAVILVLIQLSHILSSSSAKNARIKEARNRAKRIRQSRSFSEPYSASIDIDLAIQVTELDDKFDGRGDLTDQQHEIIKRILSGYTPDIIHK